MVSTGNAISDGQPLPRVAILGPFGTYSHEAADRYFGPTARYNEKLEIKDVFHALASSSADFGVVPQENTIFGSVVDTYDALRAMGRGYIVGEITLRIDHCLVARTGVRLDEIHTVLSHEQALGQCRLFIAKHLPTATTERTTSTAGAARALLDRPHGHAAICSRVCTTLFQGLEVLREAIQADSNNYTRFYVLARGPDVKLPLNRPRPSESHRTGVIRIIIRQTAANTSSSTGIQDALAMLNTSISRIDRRPLAGVPFDFVYLVEVQDEQQGQHRSVPEWKQYIETKVEEVLKAGFSVDLIGAW
ncbi:hypothetical protein CC2G_001045 [Coprinopsis cinerea AmutBmut pab1-1]|nr:hypothetical protein CC2G_001045 [Coprinopsis cinerea AmutBmut pab1-1]